MKVIIIGAVAGGSKTAAKLKRLQPDWEVVIYTSDYNVAYSECGLPYYIAGAFADVNKLIIRTPEEFSKKGIKVFVRHKIIRIMPDSHEVLVKNLDTNEEFTTNYDKLVISSGAYPYKDNIENKHLENIFTLRTIEDGINVKNAVLSGKKAVIIGGGYIGIEVLEAFVKQGLHTTVIQADKSVMAGFDGEISQIIQKYIMQIDLEHVKIISNNRAVVFTGDSRVKKVITNTGIEVDTDFVLICAGVRPNVEFAKISGIEVGEFGAIKVNSRMETNIKDIYACGDCVEKYHIVADAPCWIPLGSTANKEGRCCAINVAGGNEEFEGILGSAVTKYFNFTMSMTGLTEKMALKYGFEPVSVVVTKNDKAGYMPDVESIVIKLVADKKTHRILGTQGVGIGDVDKRVNTLTSALLSKMTVEDFIDNDITYSPPFSTSIDPMLTAAQKLMQKLSVL